MERERERERERGTRDCSGALKRRYGLTERQEEAARLMLAQLTIPEIAERRGLNPGTVKGHRIALYKRIAENSAVGVARKADEAWIAEHLADLLADSSQISCDRGGAGEQDRGISAESA